MKENGYFNITRKHSSDLEKIAKQANLYEFHAKIENFLPALVGIVMRYNNYPGKPMPLDYSLEEMQIMAETFFEDFNPRLYEKLKLALQNAEIYASEPCAENKGKDNCMRKSGDKVKMILNPTNDVEGLCCVAHENSHACSQRMTEDVKEKEQLIGEIESKFIEKVYLDWLLYNEAISQEDYDFKRRAQRQDLVVDCDSVLAEVDFLKSINHDFHFRNIQKVIWQKSNLEKSVINMQKGKVSPWLGRYIIGEIVAQVLYSEYCQNPQEISERFTDYICKNAEMGFDEAAKFLLGENYIEKINAEFFPREKQEERS